MKPKLTWTVSGALVVFALVALTGGLAAQSGSIIIKAKRIYTVTKGVVDNGAILIQAGKIKAVGASVQAPPDAQAYTADVVVPGLIDAHTHLALERGFGAPGGGPITSEWKAVDHFNPKDPAIPIVLSGGVTSAITTPGSGIISSGQAVAFKLKNDPAKHMVLKPFVDLRWRCAC